MSFWKKKDEQSPAANPSSPTPTTSVPVSVSPAPKPAAASNSAGSTTAPATEDQLQERFGKIRSALGPGTVIQGKLSFDTPVRIDGRLSGEIFSSKALIIGPAGIVDAQIEASVLIVQGSVKGNVRASERIEISRGGRLEGDVHTPTFVIEEGAAFSGACSMGSKGAASGRGKSESESKPAAKVTVPVVTVAPKDSAVKEAAPAKESRVAAKEGTTSPTDKSSGAPVH